MSPSNYLDDPDLDVADLTPDQMAARIARTALANARAQLLIESVDSMVPEAMRAASDIIGNIVACGCHGLDPDAYVAYDPHLHGDLDELGRGTVAAIAAEALGQ